MRTRSVNLKSHMKNGSTVVANHPLIYRNQILFVGMKISLMENTSNVLYFCSYVICCFVPSFCIIKVYAVDWF